MQVSFLNVKLICLRYINFYLGKANKYISVYFYLLGLPNIKL